MKDNKLHLIHISECIGRIQQCTEGEREEQSPEHPPRTGHKGMMERLFPIK
jgi:hypothetical protein